MAPPRCTLRSPTEQPKLQKKNPRAIKIEPPNVKIEPSIAKVPKRRPRIEPWATKADALASKRESWVAQKKPERAKMTHGARKGGPRSSQKAKIDGTNEASELEFAPGVEVF